MKKDETLDRAVKYIDSWLRFKFERSELPGMVVAIAHKGEQLLLRPYGYANIEAKEKMTADHVFRIASHSKTFTGTAVMQLQEKGKLRLDDYVVKYVPWLKQHKDERWQKVTIRQLLSHSAGVIRDGEDADYWLVEKPFPNQAELKAAILKSKLVFDTNIKQKYSNYGYSVLGEVIARVEGQPYNDYVTQNIIEPLGLKNTTPEYDATRGKYVTGYTRQEPHKRKALSHPDTHAMSAATGFCSTAGDLCKYFSAHFVGSGKMLDDESRKEMQRTQSISRTPEDYPEEYGLGLGVYFVDKHRIFGHGGGFPGHITKTMCDAENEVVVCVLTNCIDGNAEEIARGIWSVIYKFKDAASTKPEHDLASFEGRFMNIWGVSDFVALGNSIYEADPLQWSPFNSTVELERVDSKTLRYKRTYMVLSPGENVVYDDDGSIRSSGATMLPEKNMKKA